MVTLKHLAADGVTAMIQQVWDTLVSDVVEVDSVRTKFGIENISDRILGGSPFTGVFLIIEQVGVNDGKLFFFSALDSATLSKPYGAALAPVDVVLTAAGAGGVWGSTGTKGVRVAAYNGTGETIASDEATFTISATTQKATYSWQEIAGAAGYKVYRTDVPGTYGASSLRATVVGPTNTSYLDSGGALSSGTPAAANTTGGAGPAYGTPPSLGSFDQTDKGFGILAIGQQAFYWMVAKVPPATTEVGNRRASRRAFKEEI